MIRISSLAMVTKLVLVAYSIDVGSKLEENIVSMPS